MKHIKKFETLHTKGKEYGRNLNIENVEYYLNRFCKDFSWKDAPIYRGVYGDEKISLSNFMVYDPKAIERKSANTQNFYTWIIDNSPQWKDFPKRSKSLICATDREIADNFGEVLYRVIPFDNAKIGKCSTSDFWQAFNFPFKDVDGHELSLDDFNSMLSSTYDLLYNDIYFGNCKDKECFLSNLKKMLKKLNSLSDDELLEIRKKYKNPLWIDLEFIKKLPRTMKGIQKIFDPKENSIDLYEYNDFKKLHGFETEVWTDSKSLFIQIDIADVLEERERKGKNTYKDIKDLEKYSEIE